jgi:hypothetical protein
LDCLDPSAAGGRLTKAPESNLVRLRRPPGTPIGQAGQLFVRLVQRQFVADSLRSMVEAVEGRGNR